jgi:Kdo2-lipid IVA lauroyltransferase/acyltransferase
MRIELQTSEKLSIPLREYLTGGGRKSTMNTKSPLSHHFEYWCLRFLETVIGIIPRPLSLALGAGLGTMLYSCGVYRDVVKKNMDHVGLVSGKDRKKIVKALYRNTGKLFADFLRPSDNAPPYTIDHFDIAKAVFARGKGGIVVLAHFGNWEILANIFGMKLYDLNVMGKPMENRLVEKWLHAKRVKAHVTPIEASNVLRKMLMVLKRGGIIAMLIDQYAGGHGTSSPFLGKPASTVRTVAGMLQKTDCGIVFTYALLDNDGRYRIHIEKGPELGLESGDPRYIEAYQQAHNDVLSKWILLHPDQYFGWFHRRFKDSITY